MIAQRRAI